MLIHDQFIYFSKYNSWMNRKLFQVSSGLTDDERKRDVNAFFRSIHGTLNHILLTDRRWMSRFTQDEEQFKSYDEKKKQVVAHRLDQELYDDFEKLKFERVQTDSQIEIWIKSLDSRDLCQLISFENSFGKQQEPIWWAISHFFNHQIHHRGQVTTVLKQFDKDPGVTDFIIFLREYKNSSLK
jgi:uncharacterized damage-inducible protein DinB